MTNKPKPATKRKARRGRGRPPLPPEKRRRSLTINLSPAALDRIAATKAAGLARSLSDVVDRLALQQLPSSNAINIGARVIHSASWGDSVARPFSGLPGTVVAIESRDGTDWLVVEIDGYGTAQGPIAEWTQIPTGKKS